MATGTLQRPDQDEKNEGQQHSDDLFNHFEKEFKNPSADPAAENNAIKRAGDNDASPLAQAETNAANSANPAADTGNINQREGLADPNNLQGYYRRSKEHREKTSFFKRRKGILIGVGAGGGILSVVAGFSFLLPFKLPGIMDNIVSFAGQRVERVVQHRAQMVVMQYAIRGSAASVANGTAIVTGNPIGDLFANMRTAKFEERVLSKYGIKLEPTSDKRVKFVYNGQSLGDFSDAIELQRYLNRDDLNTKEIRRVFSLIVRDDMGSWRFFKRAKFVNWLRLKYNINKFGVRQPEEGEDLQKYRNEVQKEPIKANTNTVIKNMSDFAVCSLGNDCNSYDKLGGTEKLRNDSQAAINETLEQLDLIDGVGRRTSQIFTQVLTTKLVGATTASMIPYVGPIDTAARLQHFMGDALANDILIVKHAAYVGAASATLGASYAGITDQNKAGDLIGEVAGDFGDRFNGLEQAASFMVVNGGTGVGGVKLDEMEKINENISKPAFIEVGGNLFNTVGWAGRWPLELWYQTISRAFDFAGEKTGDLAMWIILRIPGAESQLQQFSDRMQFIIGGFFKLVGMNIDPTTIGPKLHLYITQGFEWMFNQHAKELGMRELTPAETAEIDRAIALERTENMQYLPASERLFNPHNSQSLASNLIQQLPSAQNNTFTALATTGFKMVQSAPTNLASITTPKVKAQAAVNLSNIKYYGGTNADLAQPLSSYTLNTEECPETPPNAFSHCKVDRAVMEALNCTQVKCQEMGQ